MSSDLIGWGSVVLFLIMFAVLYRLITSPSKRLEKMLDDGSPLGLRKIPRGSVEEKKLVDFFSGLFGTYRKNIRPGSVYKAAVQDAYLLTIVTRQKAPEPGGSSTQYRSMDKYVSMAPTRLKGGFSINLKPHLNFSGRLPLSLLQQIGVDSVGTHEGLLEEFGGFFAVFRIGRTEQSQEIPTGLQQVFTRFAQSSQQTWGILNFLEGEQGVTFSEGGFLVHLSQTRRPKTLDQLQTILQFGEAIGREVSR
jgi:hypothetical protein